MTPDDRKQLYDLLRLPHSGYLPHAKLSTWISHVLASPLPQQILLARLNHERNEEVGANLVPALPIRNPAEFREAVAKFSALRTLLLAEMHRALADEQNFCLNINVKGGSCDPS